MTAIKKTTKTSKTPAPASKEVRTTTKRTAAVAKAPSVRAVKSAPVVTTITARIDTGFGNALYVRGDGPGLSWDVGVPMACINSDEWQLTLGESARPVTFKLLLNDSVWSTGGDFIVAAGDRATVTPTF